MEVKIMASRLLKNFLEENNLSFETLKITKIDRDTGVEVELDTEVFLYELLNRIRHSNTAPSTKHRMVEKPIKLTDEQYITAIPKKSFELGMMETMNLGIELSSISFTDHLESNIRQLEPNIDFVMLRYGSIQNGRFYKDCDFDKYYKMARRCSSLSVGCYIYIYDLFTFEPRNIKRIIEKAYSNRFKFDYPIMFDIDSELFYDNGTLPDIVMSKISAMVRILNEMNVLFTFAFTSGLNNIITIKYPFEIMNPAERFIVPNDILSTLEPLDYITKNKKGNIMTAYKIDERGIVHCITHKGISDYIKCNHLNGY